MSLKPQTSTTEPSSEDAGWSGLHLWPAVACLITELAAELGELTEDELHETTVVLPTKRLATWLLALLAQRRGACVPPRCFTFNDFINHHAANLDAVAATSAPLGPLEQEVLLASLLKEQGYRHLKPGHEHEIRQLFAELAEWGLNERAFPALAAAVTGNVYLSDGGLDTLAERAAELASLYGRFQSDLAVASAETGEQRLARYSTLVAEALAGGSPLFPGRLYLAGLTSVSGMHGYLLQTLAGRRDVALWINEPPETHGRASPLSLLREALSAAPVRRRSPRSGAAKQQPVTVHRTPTVLDEAAHALALAGAAVESGLSPSAIALLVTNDAAYGKPLRALIKGAKLACNVALGTPFAATMLGSWTRALVDLALHGEDQLRLLTLLGHPVTLAWWQRISDDAASGSTLRERLTRELCRQDQESGQGFAWALGLPHLTADVRALISDVEAMVRPLLGSKGACTTNGGAKTRSLGAWTEAFSETARAFIQQAGPGRGQGDTDLGIRLSTQKQIEDFLTELTHIARRRDPALSRREFFTLIESQLLTRDVRSVGDPLAGVQILSVAEARYVPFELAIVLGCAEGDFPRALPRDHLLDNYLKTRIGLPGWHLLEAIEDTTFHLLRARLPALHLLYSETRAGGELAQRSRFIEAVLAESGTKEHIVAGDEALVGMLAARLPAAEQTAPTAADFARRREPQGAFDSDVWPLLATQSASSLEELIRCPYRFLLSRLRVEPVELSADDDVRREGDWLHGVLEAFFTGKVQRRSVAAPLDTSVPWEGFRDYALGRLGELTEQLVPPTQRDSPLHLHVRLAAWPAFVDHLLELYTPATLARATHGLREHRLGAGGDLASVQVGERVVQLKGSIDSVDLLGDAHVITDYKRSGSPDKASVKAGLAPQLVVYALALANRSDGAAQLPLPRAIVGYWSILKGAWQEALAGQEVLDTARERGLIGPRDKDTLDAAAERLLELWQWRQEQLLAPGGAFKPDPGECGFCRMSGVCRKDDPELAPLVAAQGTLTGRLAAHGTLREENDA